MTTTTALIIAAVLVLVGLGLGWWVGKSRRRPDDIPTLPEAPAERVGAPSEPAAEVVAAPPPVAPPVAAPVAPPVAAAPAPAPPRRVRHRRRRRPRRHRRRHRRHRRAAPPPAVSLVPPTVIMVPPPRPAAPVIERVLALEPAGEGEWAAGIALPLSPVQSASVATALAGEELTAAYAIDFAPGATMSVARADLAFMRALAANATSAGRWLDGSAAAVVAAVSLAGLANERFLESLGDEMRALKSLLAGLAPKIDGLADGRLKALVQDLSRFAREARENYASAIGKAAFRERIEDAAERALNIWRDAVERTDGSAPAAGNAGQGAALRRGPGREGAGADARPARAEADPGDLGAHPGGGEQPAHRRRRQRRRHAGRSAGLGRGDACRAASSRTATCSPA